MTPIPATLSWLGWLRYEKLDLYGEQFAPTVWLRRVRARGEVVAMRLGNALESERAPGEFRGRR